MDEIVPIHKIPSSKEAEIIIRELTQKGEISWSKHCLERMKQRGVTTPQVLNCLIKGKVTESPFLVNENGGGYETRIEKGTAGEWLRVVVCLRFSPTIVNCNRD